MPRIGTNEYIVESKSNFVVHEFSNFKRRRGGRELPKISIQPTANKSVNSAPEIESKLDWSKFGLAKFNNPITTEPVKKKKECSDVGIVEYIYPSNDHNPILLPRKRLLNKSNFVTSMASNVHKNCENPIATEIFLSGARILSMDPEAIRSSFGEIKKAIRAGYDARSDQNELFANFSKSTGTVKRDDPPEVRLKAIREYMKVSFDATKKAQELGVNVITSWSFPEMNLINVFESDHMNEFSCLLEHSTNMDFKEFNTLVEKCPRPIKDVLMKSETIQTEYKSLNVENRRQWLLKNLLKIYRRSCSAPDATKINWSSIKITGWPENVSHDLTNQSAANLDLIFESFVNGPIYFELLNQHQ
jgi:hypothetical protein